MFVLLCGTSSAVNYDFHIGGVYYRILLNNALQPTTNVEVVAGDEKYTGDIVIPSSFTVDKVEYTVTRIGQDAFYDCKDVTSVSLPNNVTSKLEVIEGRAFGNCEGLTSIRIPDTVTEIEQFAFSQCKNLKSVYMGSGLKTVRYDAFGYCDALERVDISDLAAWCGIAFYYNGTASGWFGPHANPLSYAGHLYLNGNEVVDLVIPKEVTSIHGDLNFYGCVGLKSITFPDDANVEYIGAWTFAGCENITTLKFNKHLKRIYECAFSGCKLIESLVIPDEVTLIEAAAFSGCTNLKELKLGKALEEIKTGFWGPAFSGTAIQEITVPEKLQYLSGFWNSKLSIVNIGKTSLKEIANGGRDYPLPISRINITDLSTFMNIQKKNLGGYDLYLNGNLVENLTVPSSVEDVIEYAMGSCQCLKSVTIPSHVKSIGQSAFQSCYYIGKVTFEGGSPKIEKDVFGTYDNVYFITKMQTPSEAPYALINESQRRNILCVPAGCKEKYETADGWKEFRYIVEASGPEEAFLDKGNLYRINGDGVTMLKGGAHANWGYSLPETVTYNGKTYPVTVIDGVVHEGYSPDIVIYNKVKSIAEGAFASCTGVHSVTSYLRNPFAINSNVFSDEVKQTITLRVPYGTKAKYLATDGWMEFKAIEEMEPEPATPYVVYHDGTLTFYYDDQRSSREGTTYDLNKGEEKPGWYENRSGVTKAVFDTSFASARPVVTSFWFFGCNSLHSIEGIANLNTSEVTNMYGMFAYCKGLTNLDVSGFNTSNVTNMGIMFIECSTLTNLDVSGFNTSKVTNMSSMFRSCETLANIDVSRFNTSKVTNMESMFYACKGLVCLDVSSFNTSSVTDMSFMFYACTSLTNLIFGKLFTSNESTNVKYIFSMSQPSSVGKVTFSNDIPININNSFFSLVGTAETPATLFVPKEYKENYLTKFVDNKFYGGYFTMEVNNDTPSDDIEPYAVLSSDNSVLTFYYDDKKESRGGMSVGPFNTTTDKVNMGWYEQRTKITNAVFDASFANYTSLTSTSYWFYECENLKSISNIENLRTNNVNNMAFMFFGCSSLSNLDVSGFNTANVTNMEWLFGHCSSLTDLNVSGFNTEKVTTLYGMFYDCSGLTSLDVSKFNTNNVNSMGQLFDQCSSLTSIDISNFMTEKVTSMWGMFRGCPALKTIFVDEKNWSTINVKYSDYMFSDCKNLVGGNGTKYDANQIGIEYARVDKTGAPGYFTAKNGGTEPVGDGEPYVVYNDFTLTFYYDDQRSKRSGTVYSLNEGNNEPEWVKDDNNRNVEKVVFDASFANARPTTTYSWFLNCDILKEITGIENLNTSEVKNMHTMFAFCKKLESIDLSHFDTRKVGDMGAIFSNCKSLKSIDLSHFDTSSLWMMMSMFYNCNSLTGIDLSNFSTSKVEYMDYLFYGCSSLKKLYLGSSFTSTNSVSCEEVFVGCQNLSKVIFTGDIPASINSTYFNGVGSANAPAVLYVSSQYKNNYASKFDGNMFYGGYFTLQERNAIEGDVDGDGEVTEEDIAEVEKVILNPSVGYDPDKDVNHDGVVNVADIVEEVNIINSTGKVEQVNSKVEASLTGCSRDDNGGILLTFTLKNVSGQDFGEVRVGHTGYYQNMEGSTDTGDEIHNLSVSIMSQTSGNWGDDVRFSFPANDTKSLMIGINNVPATAKSLTLQVGVYCETWEVQNDVIKFVNIPIQ